MPSERRQHRRVGFNRPVKITYTSGRSVDYTAKDFSMMGLGFDSEIAHEIGEQMKVSLEISPRGTPIELELNAEVRYNKYKNGSYHTGLQFNQRSKALRSK